MRMLTNGGALPIHKMNLSEQNLSMLKRAVRKPHGIMLVVGPTGSGKTTMLHATLGHLNTRDKKFGRRKILLRSRNLVCNKSKLIQKLA